jgi:transposase
LGFRQLSNEAIEAALPDPCERLAVLSQIQLWHTTDAQIHQVERWVLDARPEVLRRQALCSTPGIGRILGLTIALETGVIARFPTVGDYVSYCRMVKSERIANGKKKGQGRPRGTSRNLATRLFISAGMSSCPRLACGTRAGSGDRRAQQVIHRIGRLEDLCYIGLQYDCGSVFEPCRETIRLGCFIIEVIFVAKVIARVLA